MAPLQRRREKTVFETAGQLTHIHTKFRQLDNRDSQIDEHSGHHGREAPERMLPYLLASVIAVTHLRPNPPHPPAPTPHRHSMRARMRRR